MGSYEIDWKTSAEKDLRRVDPPQVSQIIYAVEKLSENPFPPGCRKLKGAERTYRLRVGKYRVLYEVNSHLKRVTVYFVRHHRNAYRG